jgi:hypothetical protein
MQLSKRTLNAEHGAGANIDAAKTLFSYAYTFQTIGC